MAKEVTSALLTIRTRAWVVVNQDTRNMFLGWIETAIKEGAKLVLDGRNPKVPAECAKGTFVGPTIFDHVTEEMTCGRERLWPVLCVKLVDSLKKAPVDDNNALPTAR